MKTKHLLMSGLAMAALSVACSTLSEAWELDHARIIAVRMDPPSLAPGQQGKLTALVVDDTGTPSEIRPAIAIVASQDPIINQALKVELGTWAVIAGDTAAIEAARAAVKTPGTDPLVLQVGARFEFGGVQRDAVKSVALGSIILQNPAAPAITLDGQALTAPPTLLRGKKYQFALSNFSVADDMLAFHWAVSTALLKKSETAAAEIEIDDTAVAGTAHLLLTVRDKFGGVSWATTAFIVQ
jgi:hypothetical protein